MTEVAERQELWEALFRESELSPENSCRLRPRFPTVAYTTWLPSHLARAVFPARRVSGLAPLPIARVQATASFQIGRDHNFGPARAQNPPQLIPPRGSL